MAGVRPVRQGGRELGHRGHSGERAKRERRSPGERGSVRGVGGARRMPPARRPHPSIPHSLPAGGAGDGASGMGEGPGSG